MLQHVAADGANGGAVLPEPRRPVVGGGGDDELVDVDAVDGFVPLVLKRGAALAGSDRPAARRALL